MSYNLRDVQYISSTHELPSGTYDASGIYGAMAIDISSMVNTQALGGRPVGLAVYRCHVDFSSDGAGQNVQAGETGALRIMVTAKDIGTTGDDITATGLNSLNSNSALNIAGMDWWGPGQITGPSNGGYWFLEPSDEVPYVVVRDTIYIIWQTGNGALTADLHVSVRLEVAPIKVTTNLMNQLIRTQSQ